MTESPVTESPVLRSEIPLGPVIKNIGTLLLENGDKFKTRPACAQQENGVFRFWSWQIFVADIVRFSAWLSQLSLEPEDRVAFITQKSYLRLVTEMAVMSMGLTSVPIFKGYEKKMLSALLKFADAKLLIVDQASLADHLEQTDLPARIFSLHDFSSLRAGNYDASSLPEKMLQIPPERTAIILFTSGTSAFPKGVMLTHRNILAQQKANEVLWKLEKGMRFLSYLPWDHVFGSLFERFFALSNGGCLCLDDSGGKNIDRLLEYFGEIRPHVFFSVPLLYEKLVDKILASAEASRKFFHPDFRFLFTASAPLPTAVSEFFQKKGIPLIEGWGLTETSPSCTLTEPLLHRRTSNVGFPIPGVEIRLGLDNEILVRGHNVMKAYFKSAEATSQVLDAQGWLNTGDIGEICPDELGRLSLRIIGRKDRIFKLSNGKKLSPQLLEGRLKASCPHIKHAYVFGQGMRAPRALIFPDFSLIPREDLDKYLPSFAYGLEETNRLAEVKYERIAEALIITAEPTVESGELTPSMKLRSGVVEQKYCNQLDSFTPGDKFLDGAVKIFDASTLPRRK